MLDHQRLDDLELKFRRIEEILERTRKPLASMPVAPQALQAEQKQIIPANNQPKPRSLDVPTSAISFVETQHGRLRREQRGIDKKDLQAAIKYGKRYSAHPRRNGDVCSKYVYNDITYIVNEVTREEVTSYAKPLELRCVPATFGMLARHERAVERIQNCPDSWTSNTVFVVDVSGFDAGSRCLGHSVPAGRGVGLHRAGLCGAPARIGPGARNRRHFHRHPGGATGAGGPRNAVDVDLVQQACLHV